jgi:hypothetical protein
MRQTHGNGASDPGRSHCALASLVIFVPFGIIAFQTALGMPLFFTSAVPIPGPYHVPPAFFYPQFLPVAVMLYWMIRIRFPATFYRRYPR